MTKSLADIGMEGKTPPRGPPPPPSPPCPLTTGKKVREVDKYSPPEEILPFREKELTWGEGL